MALAHTDETKYILKIYVELWTKIKDIIELKNNNFDNQDEKYLKIKFYFDDDLP